MNKLILTSFITIISATSFANDINNNAAFSAGVAYAPNASGGNLDGYQFKESHYVQLQAAMNNAYKGFGVFVNAGVTPFVYSGENDSVSDTAYHWTIFNAGTTYQLPINNQSFSIQAYAGVGYASATGKVETRNNYYGDDATVFETDESDGGFNITGGINANLARSYGIYSGFDSAPSSIYFGISKEF